MVRGAPASQVAVASGRQLGVAQVGLAGGNQCSEGQRRRSMPGAFVGRSSSVRAGSDSFLSATRSCRRKTRGNFLVSYTGRGEWIEHMPQTNANLIWKIADLMRGPYQPNQYGDVILPFTILRRLDCILEPTKDEVLTEYKKIASTKVDPGVLLKAKFKLPFYNTSRWTFASLIGDPEGIADNLLFAGSKNAQVATLTENMARLGHKTVDAALSYQHSQDGRDAIVAANLSANAVAELAAASDEIAPDALAVAQ